ncbi:PGPGW domain-containing protein [Cellulomonas cellasea]|uniref:TIGR02611 family protein n=2 Tax=Cellulomonas cellasea TaxID=43670 RepID=A0A0A0B4V5_9CELL|nr:PGPGW domain-containing protein [Cellulomonas cellasea]KGM00839.1 hypothetical protein Q760_05770 [Cellulomonas cellasea DSM 20118]GEA86495.1 hypothetical protein CCE01nite_04440 [Cellulomonas cellasea]
MTGPEVRPGVPDDGVRGPHGPDGARREHGDDGAARGHGTDGTPRGPAHDEAHGAHEHDGALGSVRAWLTGLPRPVRLPLVVVVGSVLLLAGAAMLVLPGPGLLVMFAGVAVLAAEFPWAGRLVVRIRLVATRVWVPVRRRLRRER